MGEGISDGGSNPARSQRPGPPVEVSGPGQGVAPSRPCIRASSSTKVSKEDRGK